MLIFFITNDKKKWKHMEWYLYQQQKSYQKTKKQQSQVLKNNREVVFEKNVSSKGFKQNWFFLYKIKTLFSFSPR